jgi:A/G-specific adenine glycosylase
MDIINFRKQLLPWGKKHFRVFPWRLTDNPYHILMAEVMLHRTQALQVVPVYEQFIRRFPDLSELANATEAELNERLYSLGLRWRISLIHEMVAQLINHFDGKVPSEKTDLLGLPGVSDYIASAVCCFAWNQPEALIDTNTVRITGRLFGWEVKDSSRRSSKFRDAIASLADPKEPKAFNYALLDLAAQVCTKTRPPDCLNCPVLSHCTYGQNHQSTDSRPGK